MYNSQSYKMIRITKVQWFGMIVAVITMVIDLIFFLNVFNVSSFTRNTEMFTFVVGIAVVIGSLPFIISIVAGTEREKEKEAMFLEFSRNLAEGVKSGLPISKSIMNVKNKDFGSLSKHVEKLANQITLGIPVRDALQIFAGDVGSKQIGRSIELIREAEKAGGDIDRVLESVAKSVSSIEELRKDRRAAIYNFVVQGYIIFFIFIIIMLVMEFKILPLTSSISSSEEEAFGGFGSGGANIDDLSRPILFLIISQAFFVGLVIGKISEGSIKSGIKHSFVLVIISYLVSSGAHAFIGTGTI
jgi:archaeal flagellar protein FlaJ